MVTEYHQRNFQYSGLELSSIFGRMNTVSGVSAIVAGLVGFSLVEFTQTKTAPFMASAVCMGAAFTIMWKEWVCRALSLDEKLTDKFFYADGKFW